MQPGTQEVVVRARCAEHVVDIRYAACLVPSVEQSEHAVVARSVPFVAACLDPSVAHILEHGVGASEGVLVRAPQEKLG